MKNRLVRELNLHPIVAQILSQREWTDVEEYRRFLYGTLKDLPDPFLLDEMEEAVQRLLRAYTRRERILFFGDYDVDGITGTAQFQAFFREIGLQTQALLPHRLHDGYGLTEEMVRRIGVIHPDLVVTIDNGTKSLDEIRGLRERGIDVIVVDHHETPVERPPVVALINPKRKGSRFPESNIASAGLVFLTLMAFRARGRERGLFSPPNLRRYLDLACLGTIADIVPLTGTNRLLAKYGLEEISKTERPGLQALKSSAAVEGAVDVGSVAFRLAPRINAAGRLSHPQIALDLLLSEGREKAFELASQMERLNEERRLVEEKVLKEAVAIVEREQQDRKGLVVAKSGWHLGVVGIVASKLAERFGRPAVVLALSEDGSLAKGSARTVPGVSIYRALKKIEDTMVRFGGHDAAAGMTVQGSRLGEFSRGFDRSVSEDWSGDFSRPLSVDLALKLQDVSRTLIKDLTLLEPHGLGNPRPVFISTDVHLHSPRLVGEKHLKMTLSQNEASLEAISFHGASYLDQVLIPRTHQVTFTIHLREWNRREEIQLQIRSIN